MSILSKLLLSMFNLSNSEHGNWFHFTSFFMFIFLFIVLFLHIMKTNAKKKKKKKSMFPRTWSIDPEKYMNKPDHMNWMNQVMAWMFVTCESPLTSTITAWIQDLNMNIAAKVTKFSAVIYAMKENTSLPSLVEIRSMKTVGNDIHGVVLIRSNEFGFLVSVQQSKCGSIASDSNAGVKEKNGTSNYLAEFVQFECWCSAVLTRMNGSIGLILKPIEKSPVIEVKMKSLSKKNTSLVKPEAVAQVIRAVVVETTFYANLSILCNQTKEAIPTPHLPSLSVNETEKTEEEKPLVQRREPEKKQQLRGKDKNIGKATKCSSVMNAPPNPTVTSAPHQNLSSHCQTAKKPKKPTSFESNSPSSDHIRAPESITDNTVVNYKECFSIPEQDLNMLKRIFERRSTYSDNHSPPAAASGSQICNEGNSLVIDDISFKPLTPGDYYPIVCTLELDDPHQQKTRFLNASSVSGGLNFNIGSRSSLLKVFLKNSPDSVDPIECEGHFMVDSVNIKPQTTLSVPVKNSVNVGLVSLLLSIVGKNKGVLESDASQKVCPSPEMGASQKVASESDAPQKIRSSPDRQAGHGILKSSSPGNFESDKANRMTSLSRSPSPRGATTQSQHRVPSRSPSGHRPPSGHRSPPGHRSPSAHRPPSGHRSRSPVKHPASKVDERRRSPRSKEMYPSSCPRDSEASHSYARHKESVLPSSHGDYPPEPVTSRRRLLKEVKEAMLMTTRGSTALKWSDVESIKPSFNDDSVILTHDGILVSKDQFSRSLNRRRSNLVREDYPEDGEDAFTHGVELAEYEASESGVMGEHKLSPGLEELIAKHRRSRQVQSEAERRSPRQFKPSPSRQERSGLYSFDDMDYDRLRAENDLYLNRHGAPPRNPTSSRSSGVVGRMWGGQGERRESKPDYSDANYGLSRASSYDDSSLVAKQNGSMFRRIVSLRDNLNFKNKPIWY